MEKTVPELMVAISPEDWAQVPTSVLALIEELVGRMAEGVTSTPVMFSQTGFYTVR